MTRKKEPRPVDEWPDPLTAPIEELCRPLSAKRDPIANTAGTASVGTGRSATQRARQAVAVTFGKKMRK